jgi:hypothetical protein
MKTNLIMFQGQTSICYYNCIPAFTLVLAYSDGEQTFTYIPVAQPLPL